ncbi:MAG: DUF937 domain-containing protein [Fimbriimonas ginsengisoli]|nr:DUF937 domain-containing protein [Fimbriimonas ginsengisoli]
MEILALVRNAFPTAAVRRTATFLGEEEAKVRRGLQEAVPAVLAALINRTSSEGVITEAGPAFVKRLLTRGSHDGGLLTEIANILSNVRSAQAIVSLGERAVEGIFASDADAVRKAVAEDCGMSSDSTAHLMSLTALVTLEVLAHETAVRQLTPETLLAQLHAQRRTIARALPAEVARFVEFYEQPSLEGQAAAPEETPVQRFKLKVMRLLA